METKFDSRAEIGGVAIGTPAPPTGLGGGGITRASLPPIKRNDRIVCGTPSSVTVKSEALSLVASDRFLRRATHVQDNFANVAADDDAGALRRLRLLGRQDRGQRGESERYEALPERAHGYPLLIVRRFNSPGLSRPSQMIRDPSNPSKAQSTS